jgi:sugar-specific transcriptional regulator TrmB
MLVSEKLLSRIRRNFALNLYEARIWAALLSRGRSTAGELSDIANVPRSRTYDVLESLEKKGFAMMKLGKPIQYMAVSPTEVIERVKKNVRESLKQKEDDLDNLKNSDSLKKLDTLFRKGVEYVDPTELSGIVKGRTNIYSKLENMITAAKKDVTLVTSASGAIRKVEALKRVMERAKKRGVNIRFAAPQTKDNKEVLGFVKKLTQFKNLSNFDARFAVVDNKEVLFMLLPDHEVHPKYDVGVWVQSELFANALNHMTNKAIK